MVELVELGHSFASIFRAEVLIVSKLKHTREFRCRAEARILRGAFQVPISRESAAKRTPYSAAQALLVEEPAVFGFESVSHEDRILGLFAYGADQFMLSAGQECLHNERGGPLADAPVEGLSSADEIGKCAANFFHGSIVVGSVTVYDVDVVQLHVLERAVHGLHHLLAG